MPHKHWVSRFFSPSCDAAQSLARDAGISPFLAALALGRGIDNAKSFAAFTEKSPVLLHDPFLMKDMRPAVDRIEKAIQSGESILIYGDYDVDGITSTAILLDYLQSRGANVEFYIPDRLTEGYGLTPTAVNNLLEKDIALIITVDTGVSAVNEIAILTQHGIDLVVTDHHVTPETIPDATAVVCPTRPDCEYPFKQLAGVGVCFKLLCALSGDNVQMLDRYAALVALGTTADMVSMRDENRILTTIGIEQMRKNTDHIGLWALLEQSGLGQKIITTSSMAFTLAPRINAAGRLGDSRVAVDLLLAKDRDKALALAQVLCQNNKDRQSTETAITAQAIKSIELGGGYKAHKILVVVGENWHQGVLGIVASRITEKYDRPCIVIGIEDGIGKGSGRSVPGFNLFGAIKSAQHLLIRYGGHPAAIGLSINQTEVAAFCAQINQYAEENLNESCLTPTIEFDFALDGEHLRLESVYDMAALEPYGMDNPEPLFCVQGATVQHFALLSEGKHLRMTMQKDDTLFQTIAFGKGHLGGCILPGMQLDLLGELDCNEFRGDKKLQLRVRDIHFPPDKRTFSRIPNKNDLNTVFLYLKNLGGAVHSNRYVLPKKLEHLSGLPFDDTKVQNCIEILSELGLCAHVLDDEEIDLYLKEKPPGKLNLAGSQKYQSMCAKEGLYASDETAI